MAKIPELQTAITETEKYSISAYCPEIDLLRDTKLAKIQTGFTKLQKELNGLHCGITVIAGGTGTGKTTFALQLAYNLVKYNNIHFTEPEGDELPLKILPIFVSLELTKARCYTKLMTLNNTVDTKAGGSVETIDKIKLFNADECGRMLAGDNSIDRAIFEITKKNFREFISNDFFLIDDISDPYKIAKVAKDITRIKQSETATYKYQPVIFIDYLQYMRCDGYNRKDEIDHISKALVELSKEISTPIFLISAVNRESVKDGKKITLTSLKESGQIEYDAEAVILLNSRTEGNPNEIYSLVGGGVDLNVAYTKHREMEITVAKNHHGNVNRPINFKYYPALEFFEEGCAADEQPKPIKEPIDEI